MTRTEALCNVLGWQGGTIHQVAKETGCALEDLLYGQPKSEHLGSSYTSGWFASRTCSLLHRQQNVFPQHHGDIDFWIGAAEGIMDQTRMTA
jgi:hypothetical protein